MTAVAAPTALPLACNRLRRRGGLVGNRAEDQPAPVADGGQDRGGRLAGDRAAGPRLAARSSWTDRGRGCCRETVAQVADALRSGDSVQVFPEGTTTCGAHPARWRPAFLQAALDAGAPVQRFTLLFSTQRAAFVDEETLLTSLWRVLRLRGLSITVLVDEAKPTGAANRKELAARLSPKRLNPQKRVHDGRRA